LFRTPSLSSFCFATFSIAGEMSHRVTEYPIFVNGSVILPVPPAASKIFTFLFLGRYPFRSFQSTWCSTALEGLVPFVVSLSVFVPFFSCFFSFFGFVF
jgi:hypothetical protein